MIKYGSLVITADEKSVFLISIVVKDIHRDYYFSFDVNFKKWTFQKSKVLPTDFVFHC